MEQCCGGGVHCGGVGGVVVGASAVLKMLAISAKIQRPFEETDLNCRKKGQTEKEHYALAYKTFIHIA